MRPLVALWILGCGAEPIDTPAVVGPAVDAPSVPEGVAELVASTTPTFGMDADDAAIWIDDAQPERSVVIGNDKTSGLFVWSLEGELLQHVPLGTRSNNVDVRKDVDLGGVRADVVAANLRTEGKLAVLIVNPSYTAGDVLIPIAGAASEGNDMSIESYGFAMHRSADGKLFVFDRAKEPTRDEPDPKLRQYRVDGTTSAITVEMVRELDYEGGVSEGLVADDELGMLYVTEERGGIHRFAVDPNADGTELGGPFAIDDGIVGDREGVALYQCAGGGGYLVLSSQGDSSFKIYDRTSLAFLATVAAHAELGTDGLDVTSSPAGVFQRGFLVAQDDVEKRFHLYDFEQIAASVGLPLCP